MPYPELEELYNTYRTDLYRYLCHLTHDPAEAEDLLSETFLRALRRLHTYRGDCAVKTWLFGIAHNVWLESLRKRRPTVSADDLLETYRRHPAGPHRHPPAMAAGTGTITAKR